MSSKATGLCGFLGAQSPGPTPWAGGTTATPALGCAPGRATGTQLQRALLKAWVEEEGSFPPVLVSVLSSELKSDGYLGEGFILGIGPLKSFSSPPAFALKDFLFPCLFPKAFPFPCFPITEGGKKFLNANQQQQIK